MLHRIVRHFKVCSPQVHSDISNSCLLAYLQVVTEYLYQAEARILCERPCELKKYKKIRSRALSGYGLIALMGGPLFPYQV
jgi:hypothetical protein